MVFCLCNAAAMKLRMSTRAECACRPARHMQVFASATEPPSSSDWSSNIAAALRCMVQVDTRCVLVSVGGTLYDGECLPRTDQAPQAFWLCNGAAIKLRLIELACSCSTACAVQACSR